MAKIPATRSGWAAATWIAHGTPAEKPTSTARSTPTASITATVSAAKHSSVYAVASAGRLDAPVPRPSNRTTRKWRAR